MKDLQVTVDSSNKMIALGKSCPELRPGDRLLLRGSGAGKTTVKEIARGSVLMEW